MARPQSRPQTAGHQLFGFPRRTWEQARRPIKGGRARPATFPNWLADARPGAEAHGKGARPIASLATTYTTYIISRHRYKSNVQPTTRVTNHAPLSVSKEPRVVPSVASHLRQRSNQTARTAAAADNPQSWPSRSSPPPPPTSTAPSPSRSAPTAPTAAASPSSPAPFPNRPPA